MPLTRAATWFREVAGSPFAAAALAILVGFLAGHVLVALVRPALARAARRSAASWDDSLVDALATPLSLLVALQGARAASPWLPLDAPAVALLRSAIGLLTTVIVLWLAFRSVDIAQGVLEQRSWAQSRPASRSLLAIGARIAKVVVVALALVITLAHLGVSIASLLAGLGIGGLAVALAAQKTVENLFGTLSLGVDQPLREGDFVRVEDTLGTVETIGLRSTRIRTLDRTLVTLPNGRLADMRIESYTVRDRMRLACTLGLVYGTTSVQLRDTLASLEDVLRGHPKIWPETVVVKFLGFGESSLDVEIMAWFMTSDWGEFQGVRQEVLFQFMEVVERHGTSFAFPTRTLHLVPGEPIPHAGDASNVPGR